jgi:hypothetical protein
MTNHEGDRQLRVLLLDDHVDREGVGSAKALIERLCFLVTEGHGNASPEFAGLPKLSTRAGAYQPLTLGDSCGPADVESAIRSNMAKTEIVFIVLAPMYSQADLATKALSLIDQGVYLQMTVVLVDLDWLDEGNNTYGEAFFATPLLHKDPAWIKAKKIAMFSGQKGNAITTLIGLGGIGVPCFGRSAKDIELLAGFILQRWLEKVHHLDGLKPGGICRVINRACDTRGAVITSHNFLPGKPTSKGLPYRREDLDQTLQAIRETYENFHELRQQLLPDHEKLQGFAKSFPEYAVVLKSVSGTLEELDATISQFREPDTLRQAFDQAIRQALALSAQSNNSVSEFLGNHFKSKHSKDYDSSQITLSSIKERLFRLYLRHRSDSLAKQLGRAVVSSTKCAEVTVQESEFEDHGIYVPKPVLCELLTSWMNSGIWKGGAKNVAFCITAPQPNAQGVEPQRVGSIKRRVLHFAWDGLPLAEPLESKDSIRSLIDEMWVKYVYDLYVTVQSAGKKELRRYPPTSGHTPLTLSEGAIKDSGGQVIAKIDPPFGVITRIDPPFDVNKPLELPNCVNHLVLVVETL